MTPILAALLLAVSGAGALVPAAARAADGSAPSPSARQGTYQICLFPNPCGATLLPSVPRPAPEMPEVVESAGRRDAPPKAAPNALYAAPDRLTQTILQGRLADEDEGVVSALRVRSERGGRSVETIVYRGGGTGSADSPLNPVGRDRLSLPDARLPARDAARGAAQDDWARVDSAEPAAGQLNAMRDEQGALRGGADAARTATQRMWKEAPPVKKR